MRRAFLVDVVPALVSAFLAVLTLLVRDWIEVVFRVDESTALGPRQRDRLLERLGAVVTAVSADSRSQARNRTLALERLRSKLAAGLHVTPARRPTRPSASASAERVEQKRRRSEVKRTRRPPAPED